jgi:heptosyltransferase-2
MRILVRATNWLGDAILSVPALDALRAAHPAAHIAVAGLPWVEDLYGGQGFCDEVIVLPAGTAGQLRVGWGLRGRFDRALLLPNAFAAAAFAWATGAPVRTGYDRDGRGWLLTEAIAAPSEKRHERFYYLELLRRAGWIAGYDAEAPVRLGGYGGERVGRVGVSPGAAFGLAKRWYPERFAEAAVAVAREKNWSVALFGGAGEAALAREVEGLVRAAGVRVENFAAKTRLREFIAEVARCNVMLTNDSGAMHVAYAVGTPSVTVFGPTDPAGTGPVGATARIVREAVDCAPCKLRECPIDHRCMKAISAERVAREALVLLK